MTAKANRRIFCALVIAHLLVSPFWFVIHDPDGFSLGLATHLALLFAQGMLLACWLAIPGRRLSIALLVTGLYWAECLIWNAFLGDSPFLEESLVMVIVAAACTVLSIALYILLRMRHITLLSCAELASTDFANVRFSIRDLMLATVGVAVIMALRPYIDDTVSLKIVVISLCMFVVPPLAVWACLSATRPVLPVVAVIAMGIAIGAILPLYFEFYRPVAWFWPTVFGLQAAIMTGSLLVVRGCGWRLARRVNPDIVESPLHAEPGS